MRHGVGPAEVVARLRAMAEGYAVRDRAWLFHAAHLIQRSAETVWTCHQCQGAITRPGVTVTLHDVIPQMGEIDE